MNVYRLHIPLVLALLLLALPACAQNRIDRLVENFATVGSSSFTSVVERDPDTRQVKKVVRVLQMNTLQTKKFVTAFQQEKESGTFSHQRQGDEQSFTLTCEKPNQVRIYALRVDAHGGKVTIIVKNR